MSYTRFVDKTCKDGTLRGKLTTDRFVYGCGLDEYLIKNWMKLEDVFKFEFDGFLVQIPLENICLIKIGNENYAQFFVPQEHGADETFKIFSEFIYDIHTHFEQFQEWYPFLSIAKLETGA